MNWGLIIYSFINHGCRFSIDHIIDTGLSKTFQKWLSWCVVVVVVYFILSRLL